MSTQPQHFPPPPDPPPADAPAPDEPITEIQTLLDSATLARYAGFLIIVAGVALVLAGVFTLFIPLALAGAAIVLLGTLWYVMERWNEHHPNRDL